MTAHLSWQAKQGGHTWEGTSSDKLMHPDPNDLMS